MIAGRVIMLSRDRGLASMAGQLVGRGQPLTCFSSPSEVPDWLRPPTGAVVLDFPKAARGVVYRQLRQRFPGPVLALLDPEEASSGLPTDRGRLGVLHRPFTGEELFASLDALVGSRNRARRSKSASLTVRPVGTGASAAAVREPTALDPPAPTAPPREAPRAKPAPAAPPTPAAGPAPAAGPVGAVGVPASREPARRRVNSLILALAAAAALLLGATLGDGRDCRSARCGSAANAIENAKVGIPPAGPVPTPLPTTGSGEGASGMGPASPTAVHPPSQQGMVIPIASGVGDLISGTSSSSGGAPLLVVTGGSGSPAPTSGSGGGSTGGGTPPSTTLPPATTSPVTTTPATTSPPAATTTTAPATTLPPTTTEPATTLPTTTEPATTAPATTAASGTTLIS